MDIFCLKDYCTQDSIIKKVDEKIKNILPALNIPIEIGEISIFFVDYTIVPTDIKQAYYTALMSTWPTQKVIVINVNAILELEVAIRSFANYGTFYSCKYLESDESLFSLIRLINKEPGDALKKCRKSVLLDPFKVEKEEIPDELTMAILFFICHEIGHLIKERGTEKKDFGAFFSEKEDEELAYHKAIVKLCRHVEEFEFFGFGLPGFVKAAIEKSEVRKYELELRKEIERIYDNSEYFFSKENEADEIGTNIMITYLNIIEQADNMKAEGLQFALVKGLFVSGLYFWMKDLLDLCCGPKGINIGWPINSRKLTLELLINKENYVKTAKLFGNQHRFTLLRAVLGMEEVLKRKPVSFTNRWVSRYPKNQSELTAWRTYESYQRYKLLLTIMDTAVKFAYIGCSSPYLRQVDQNRGTEQLFLMKFDSLQKSMNRIQTLNTKFTNNN